MVWTLGMQAMTGQPHGGSAPLAPAEVTGGDADFAAASVLTTHAACILTIPLWLRLLGVA